MRLEKDRKRYLEMSVLRKLPGFDRLVECYCLCLFKETSAEKSEKVVWSGARASVLMAAICVVSKEVLS